MLSYEPPYVLKVTGQHASRAGMERIVEGGGQKSNLCLPFSESSPMTFSAQITVYVI